MMIEMLYYLVTAQALKMLLRNLSFLSLVPPPQWGYGSKVVYKPNCRK